MCRHSTGQRLVNPADVSSDINVDTVAIEGNELKIEWSDFEKCAHKGFIPLNYLREHNYNRETLLKQRQAVKCSPAVSEIPTIEFSELMGSKEGLLKWLQQINEDGLSIIKDVPTEESMVTTVAELMGPVFTTIYGTTFDVEAVPDPINVAYSSEEIGFHMDLVYFESPPGVQLLHCLKFDKCVEGGESIFLDAFTVADQFRVKFPDLFKILTEVPGTFQKVHYNRAYPVHIVNQKPHIKLNHLGEIVAVYWAPPFEGPLLVNEGNVEKYYKAYEMFAKCINSSPHTLTHRLQPGELVAFNNQRMLHGRHAFQTNKGTRHLKGCYVNIDVFKSMTQVLNNMIGDGRLAKRVGNQCWF
ncbi:uncharacterized protein LOC131943364 [Physella acuta]|uniref:uncharacterized protein LOC131943364 n=1 Tax=Physella acuta TaxID=109671 RepID=UPI0027DE2BBA|nr:uncharacterized protein LOC131943364 [Physella acuta]